MLIIICIFADGQCETSLSDLLAFFSGCDRVPVLGFVPSPTLHFNQIDKYPTASTCAMELVLPSQYTCYTQFKENMIFGLLNNGGFGKN